MRCPQRHRQRPGAAASVGIRGTDAMRYSLPSGVPTSAIYERKYELTPSGSSDVMRCSIPSGVFTSAIYERKYELKPNGGSDAMRYSLPPGVSTNAIYERKYKLPCRLYRHSRPEALTRYGRGFELKYGRSAGVGSASQKGGGPNCETPVQKPVQWIEPRDLATTRWTVTDFWRPISSDILITSVTLRFSLFILSIHVYI